MFEQIAIEGITLDVDSTVMTRYVSKTALRAAITQPSGDAQATIR